MGLGKTLRVTPTGTSPTKNDLGGYSIMQAESKEALGETSKGHPHFMTPEAVLEVVELVPMPETRRARRAQRGERRKLTPR